MSSLRKSHDIDSESAANSDGGGHHVAAVTDGGGELRFDGIEVVQNENNKKGQDERRESNASECSVEIVDLEAGLSEAETKVHLAKIERDCRICHLSLDAAHQDSGVPFELGCSCKADLAAAHKQCAEAWFKIKGNKTCEICGSIARNVLGVNEMGSTEPCNDVTEVAALPTAPTPSSQVRNLWQGHRFLNFLLACMVFAFVVSWLFHFNVRS
ncbi:uncharacterized protein [Henckelia pumila]|uniref:uncharacterized protein n=1 Tax=Henckelia pumila TaxID=405737 RepID=UPI003C6E21F7